MKGLAALLRIKILLAFRTFTSRGTRLTIVIASLMLLLFFAAFFSFSRDIAALLLHNTARDLAALQRASTLLGFCLVLALAALAVLDFFSTYTLQTGQRAADLSFLQSLPVSFSELFILKLLERSVCDIGAHIFVFLPLLALSVQVSGKAAGLLNALLSYSSIQLLLGALLFSLNTFLARLFPVSRLSSLSHGISLVTSLSIMGGFAFSDRLLASLPAFLESPYMKWNPLVLPAKWLLLASSFPGRAFTAALEWTALCTLLISLCAFFSHRCWHAGWGESNVYGRAATAPAPGRGRLLSGWYRKELLLLSRDNNVLVNALLLPPAVFAMLLLSLSHSGLLEHRLDASTLLLIVSGGLVYFHGFGALNSVGAEGPSIAHIALLPVSPAAFLAVKIIVWSALGAAIFIAFYCGCLISALPADQTLLYSVYASQWLLILSFSSAAAAVGLSALFADYKGKFLQQSSSWSAKILFLTISSFPLLAQTLFHGRKPAAARIIAFFTLFCCALFYKASARLSHPHETSVGNDPGIALSDGLLLLFAAGLAGPLLLLALGRTSFFGFNATENAYFSFITTSAACAILAYIHLQRTQAALIDDIFSFPGSFLSKLRWAAACLPGGILVGLVASRFSEFSGTGIGFGSQRVSGGLLFGICLLVPLFEEFFFRGVIQKSFRTFVTSGPAIVCSALLFAAVHPASSFPVIFMLGLACAAVYDYSGYLPAVWLLHCAYNITVTHSLLSPIFYSLFR